jgi:hypothetical protein
MYRFNINDVVYRSDSGDYTATVTDRWIMDDSDWYHITYEEGSEGDWPGNELFYTKEERDAAFPNGR